MQNRNNKKEKTPKSAVRKNKKKQKSFYNFLCIKYKYYYKITSYSMITKTLTFLLSIFF